MEKKNIAVIFGGKSSEHEISCMSVITIVKAIDEEKYNVYLIGITKDGTWLLVDGTEEIEDGSWRQSKKSAILSPDAKGEMIVGTIAGNTVTNGECIKIDVVFPVLHGMYGEDGTIQGLFEIAGIPYVGCGVLASAAAMDKFYTKLIVDTLNIRQANYVPVLRNQLSDMDAVVGRVEAALDYPVFVKPSKAGSSKGVSKAEDRAGLIAALNIAAEHDYKILVEETIFGRELECAVLGHDKTTKASGVGEILAAADFYDFDAKYNSGESKTVIGPELPSGVEEKIREYAIRIFNALDGFGLSRVDFFLEKDTNAVVFNEINTLPGFTSISMYPMLWAAKGYDIRTLVDTLIEMSGERE
ncbi:MAG: D-alanine--D-alanine ligase [Clostridium sp.]|nr:D-alanine--D-alanine ligase [Clostridium sp.]MCM1460754.1 D-alanine--D-alanine ligase [Bacteroides sp.]